MRQYIGSPSHYCRSTSKRKYLDSKLTVTKIYEQFRTFFQEKVPSDNTDRKVPSEDVYRHIFVLNLIWVFMSPKKISEHCVHKNGSVMGTPQKMAELQEHLAGLATA